MARSYVVKKGDTLKRIARSFLGDPKLFTLIADYNGIRDPNRIFPGQRIEIPARRDMEPIAAPVGLPSGISPPRGLPEILATFGNIYEYFRDDGTLDPQWEADQLARAPLPFPIPLSWDPAKSVERLYCHKKLVAVFPEVFQEVDRRGLRPFVRSFGGCFNFRAKRGSNKLSVHSWGIAIDLNPETNRMGTPGDIAPGLVEVFASFGFTWGGLWSGGSKDPMHFQFCSGY